MATEAQSEDYLDGSTLARLTRQIRAYLAATWFVRAGRTLSDGLATAADTAALASGGRTLARWTRHSYLYRWLTAEPDPDVIVIDLRETYTVGPMIAVLDRLAPAVDRVWKESLAARATARFRTSAVWTWLRDSGTVRLLRAALEPPEPPEEARHD